MIANVPSGVAAICDGGHVVSIPCRDWDGTAGHGTGGQSTSGTTQAGSYRVTAVPAPRVPRSPVRPRPAVRAQDTLTRSAACRARPGPGGRTRQASPNHLQTVGRHTGRSNPQPHPHHSEEVLRARLAAALAIRSPAVARHLARDLPSAIAPDAGRSRPARPVLPWRTRCRPGPCPAADSAQRSPATVHRSPQLCE
jgi:hypothetical protein